jgi:hypothetical protein
MEVTPGANSGVFIACRTRLTSNPARVPAVTTHATGETRHSGRLDLQHRSATKKLQRVGEFTLRASSRVPCRVG